MDPWEKTDRVTTFVSFSKDHTEKSSFLEQI